MSDPIQAFFHEREAEIAAMGGDEALRQKSLDWMQHAGRYRYCYNSTWLGRPIIKHPTDIQALQELIWRLRPELVIETGIAHGGGLIFYASLLELIGQGQVIGVDIEIRPHNREAILSHPLAGRITLIEGSSISEAVLEQIRPRAAGRRVMVCLDSLHTHEHVLKELTLYAPLVSPGSYLICMDTHIEAYPPGYYADRPWDVGNNPQTAVNQFLKTHPEFEPDLSIDARLMISESPGGYLQRIR